MRLWSLNPALLDRRGLVTGWREGLLAQKVLAGETNGYRHHPQLERFRAQPDPIAAIVTYLHSLADDADRRGYNFDRTRLKKVDDAHVAPIEVSMGQLNYEFEFLSEKVRQRDPDWYAIVIEQWSGPLHHPLMTPVEGPIASWERPKL